MVDSIPLLIDADSGVDHALVLLVAFDDPAHRVVAPGPLTNLALAVRLETALP